MTRLNFRRYKIHEGKVLEYPDGEWMLHEDHKQVVDDYLVRIGALADEIDSLDNEITYLEQRFL